MRRSLSVLWVLAMKVQVRNMGQKPPLQPFSGTGFTPYPSPVEPANAPGAFTTTIWTSEPNSDAVGGHSSDSEFSMWDSEAHIVLPSKGVMGKWGTQEDPGQG